MRAAYYTELGTAADVLTVGEVEMPEPGPGEVRVKISTSGVNPSDWKSRLRGRGGVMAFPKIIPHSDGAGIVDAVGEGADTTQIGQRVWVLNGQWKRPFGTAAEYISQQSRYVIPMPDNTSFDEGACFGIPFLTAHRAVFYDGPVAGKTLLVQGGAGAVGHHAVQIAKHGGARVIATGSSQEKADLV
ncbi:MAG: NADPH:quinone reductase, partial [Proteobacteria bacterium]|nr:NADPH:quinone reductase [Pseudomonadota bacterium]